MTKSDRYFALWAVFLPITSILVFPSVQGTTPAYLLAFCSLPFMLFFFPARAGRPIKWLVIFLAIFVSLNIFGQISLRDSETLDISQLRLVNPYSGQLLLRTSLFTQSLYLLAGVLTFLFVAMFYRPHWDRYILLGAAVLAVYGLYEFFFYLAFDHSGDFLSNRTFEAGDRSTRGSLFQILTIAGIKIMRFKSLTGEPSMYAFTILPYWIYAVHRHRRVLQTLLLVTLLLTFTTSALFGLAVYVIARLFMLDVVFRTITGRVDRFLLLLALVGLFGVALFWPVVVDFVDEMIIAKFALASVSGAQRFENFWTSYQFFLSAPLPSQLFGIGFGYIRSTDFFTTILVNNGIIGFTLFSGVFLYPVFRLDHTYRNVGLKAALLVVYATMMIAVSEFAYLSIWLFLGLAYNALIRQRREGAQNAVSN
jgi:hypothetical protein